MVGIHRNERRKEDEGRNEGRKRKEEEQRRRGRENHISRDHGSIETYNDINRRGDKKIDKID